MPSAAAAVVPGPLKKSRRFVFSLITALLYWYAVVKLSILMPVYNERTVVERCISLVLAAPLPENMDRELIIVDDCSTDGTYAILERLAAAHPEIRFYQHAVNQGKGAAVRTAIQYASGDFSLIQDADLEYDPQEYPILLKPLLDGRADAVFGSRYMAGEQTRVLLFWHSMINKALTLISNMFCNLNLTDMETCYKVFRTDLLKSIPDPLGPLRLRAGDRDEVGQAEVPHLRSAHQLSRPHLRRGQEDRLEGRREGAGRGAEVLAGGRSYTRPRTAAACSTISTARRNT